MITQQNQQLPKLRTEYKLAKKHTIKTKKVPKLQLHTLNNRDFKTQVIHFIKRFIQQQTD